MKRAALCVMASAFVLGHGLAVQFRHVHGGEALLQTTARRSAANRSAASTVDISDMLELVEASSDEDDSQTAGIEGSSENSMKYAKENETEIQVSHLEVASNASRNTTHGQSEATYQGRPAVEVVALVEVVSAMGFRALLAAGGSAASWVKGAILLCILLLSLSLIVAGCLGRVVKASIEALDRSVMGVDVEIGHLSINPFQAYILVEDVVVHNPDGYEAPYLMKIDKVYVNLNASTLCCSCFKHIVVDDLVFTGLHVIYAKKLLTSNFNDVIDFMALKDSTEEKKKEDDEAKEKTASPMEITLLRVLVEDVGMMVQAEIGGGHGPRLEVGNMDYTNFSEEVGGGGALLSTAVSLLMRTILKSAVVNTMGQGAVAKFSEMNFLKSAEGAEEKASNALSSIASHLKEAVHHGPGEEAGAAKERKASGSWFRNPLSTSSPAPAADASQEGIERRGSGSWFRNPLARRNSA